MTNGFQTLLQSTPEHFSGSESDAYEIGINSIEIPRASEYETYVDHLAELTQPVPVIPAEPRRMRATSAAELAQMADRAAMNILWAREREIHRDITTPVRATDTQPTGFRKIAEFIFGKKTTDVISISNLNIGFNDPYTRYLQAERSYQQREIEASREAMTPRHGIFLRDAHTFAWHDSETDNLVFYHLRPDGVLKQVNDGASKPLIGTELEDFGKVVQTYYQTMQTVYN